MDSYDSIVINENDAISETRPVEHARKTFPWMSEFEYSALISARMLQLHIMGHTPLVHQEIPDVMSIAKAEIDAYLPYLAIRRRFSDGSSEDWLLRDKTLVFPR